MTNMKRGAIFDVEGNFEFWYMQPRSDRTALTQLICKSHPLYLLLSFFIMNSNYR